MHVFRVEDRCYVRLERLLAFMPDTAQRAELLAYLWYSDLSQDDR